MPLSFMKESKSAVTIRRKRQRTSTGHSEFGVRHKSASVDENSDLTEEDPDPTLDRPPQLWLPVLRLIMSSEKTLFLGLLAFRIVNALMIQTSYVPDEFWQSIEVAHKMTFGYGYLTWEWKTGIRSYLYPSIFAFLFKILAFLKLDTRILLIKLPRLLQAVFAALSDLYLFKFSCKLQNQRVGNWALLCQLTSWFTFYCATRTLTNSMETTLTTIALYYFPWPGKPRKAHWKYITLIGIAVMIRPTAAIMWIPLCLWHIILYQNVAWKVIKLFAERGFIVVSMSSLVDRIFYGRWVNVHYNFLETNVFASIGSFYGTHPWHWYLTQGFPILLGAHIFPFIAAARQNLEKTCSAIIFWTVFAYSLLAHKEFRFLMPVLPLCMHVCACYIHQMVDTDSTDQEAPTKYPSEVIKKSKAKRFNRRTAVIIFLIVTNLPLALYTGLIHQRGTVDVMRYFHNEISEHGSDQINIMFLMPCHSTPYFSYIHYNVSMKFLTCEPNLHQSQNYSDEAERFYTDPGGWLQHQFKDEGSHPTHIAHFNALEPQLVDFFSANNYTECATFFHTHFPEGRVGSHVVVRCLQSFRSHSQKLFSSKKFAR